MGRLSNPPGPAETLATQRPEQDRDRQANTANTRNRASDDPSESPREEKGQLSNPTQRRLSPTDVDALINDYRTGATINQLAANFGVHRTTVAAHLDHHQIPRHREQTSWDDDCDLALLEDPSRPSTRCMNRECGWKASP
jgi:hypothetical protein